MRLDISAAAEEDLTENFAVGIESFGLEEAEKYLASLHRVFNLLATFPKMARERPGFAPSGLRVHRHGRHYIAYIVESDRILVVRVVRDDADLDLLFGKLE